MNAKEKTITVQRDIIKRLIELELQISKLYETYAARFPVHSSLWLGLSKEEKKHAAFLKGVERNTLDQGYLLQNIGGFSTDLVKPTIEQVETEIANAEKLAYKSEDAINYAIKIESSLLDSHFYDKVTSDAPGYKAVANVLVTETRKHLDEIRQLQV